MSETHENKNCLAGMKCPKCGSLGPFMIVCEVIAEVHDSGTEAEHDHEWDDDNRCTCPECGLDGKVGDFGAEKAKKFCHDPRHEKPCPLPCEACKEECDPECWRAKK